jgi:DNA topoisomerase-2
MIERTVEDFFDHELLDYAHYTLRSRAIPSAIDGFKPSQRKIAHAANQIWKTGKEKPMKVFQFGGLAASMTFFHHGSMDGTIIGMTQTFKNSLPIFDGIGQFGSLRSPEAGAPRYVGLKSNDNFRLLYKDFDLTISQEEEGESIEPKFFLPIVPTVLLNGGSGIAVGFATNILNRNPSDLIKSCLLVLKGKPCPAISPWVNGFTGTFKRVADARKSWTIHGKYDVKNTTTVEVTEVPLSWTYEKYEEHLDKLIANGMIVSYDDHSATTPHYVIKFKRTVLDSLIQKNKLEDTLRMQERVGENYTTLDENSELKIFESAEEIVEYFVKFRLTYYDLRKQKLIQKLQDELKVASNRCRFINEILSDILKINNRPKKDIETNLLESGYDKVGDDYNYLLNLAIHTLTKEKAEELRLLQEKKVAELEATKKLLPAQMYESDLRELLKKFK